LESDPEIFEKSIVLGGFPIEARLDLDQMSQVLTGGEKTDKFALQSAFA
jgi:hypothetical protein